MNELARKRSWVYIAAPLTPSVEAHTSLRWNLSVVFSCADFLLAFGYVPFVPHALYLWEEYSPKGYERWMALDFEYLSGCDALLRLPGVSPGADREEAYARENGIPVFTNLEDLTASLPVFARPSLLRSA